MYGYLVTGNGGGFHQLISSKQMNVHELRGPTDRSSVLHIAAYAGQVMLVGDILTNWPDLMVVPNSKGDLPIHSTLKACRLNIVHAMMTTTDWVVQGIPVDEVYGWKNGEGNSPLHIALENDEHELAEHLVDQFPKACFLMNSKGVCPLYMAIKKDLFALALHMLSAIHPVKEEASLTFKEGKSILHAALSAEVGTDILEDILMNYPDLINSLDEEGRRPLSYIAYMGDLLKVQHLLKIFPNSAFICDEDQNGSFPIHQAVRGGHIKIVEELTITKFLSNARGQNVLHVAAQTGDSELVTHILKFPEVDPLINQKDDNGHTALHLATMKRHPTVVDVMIQDKRTKVRLLTKDGLTAIDMVVQKPTLSKQDDSVCSELRFIFDRARDDRNLFSIKELYGLIVDRDINQVNQIVSQKGLALKDLECLEDKSNILHIAAITNQHMLIANLLTHYDCASLMFCTNNEGDHPLHTAAKVGKLESLQALYEYSDVQPDRCGTIPDKDGNTTLHIAILTHQWNMAKFLLQKCPEAAFHSNKNKICPLFLAITDRFWGKLIYDMIDLCSNLKHQNMLKEAKSVVHAAISMENSDVLMDLIDTAPELINLLDIKGRSPLSYAAHMGNAQEVQFLLIRFPALAYKRDKEVDRSLAIHLASKRGHVNIVKLLCSTMLLLNNKCQNILHVAAKAGNSHMVTHLLKMQEFKDRINVGDQDGNTALHLAVMGFHPQVVYILTREKHINVNSINKESCTAMDLLHNQCSLDAFYFGCIVWLFLEDVGGRKSSLHLHGKNKETTEKTGIMLQHEHSRFLRESMNAMMLTATLIVTVTFASGFAIPGGFNQSGPYVGMATLAPKVAFQVFVICNSFACFSSFASALMLMDGMLSAKDALQMGFSAIIAAFFLSLALNILPVAFMLGAFVALGNRLWLGILVLVLGVCIQFGLCIARRQRNIIDAVKFTTYRPINVTYHTSVAFTLRYIRFIFRRNRRRLPRRYIVGKVMTMFSDPKEQVTDQMVGL